MIKASIITLLFQFQASPDSVELVNSQEIIEQVATLNEEENYDESILLLQKVNKADSNYVKAQINLISTYEQNAQLNKSIEIGAELMQERNDLPSNFYMTLGNAYLNHGYTDEAIDTYSKGLVHYPYYHPLIYNKGFAKYTVGEYEASIRHFQEVLWLNPFYTSAHQMMGNIMAMTNQRTKAIMAYLTYLAINPDKNWALVRINNLVNDAYRKEGSLNLDFDNQLFEYYDNLLRSNAALDDRYKTQIDFEAPVAQQCELLLTKLKYVSGTDDFWMEFYVPFLTQIAQKELTEPFIYFMLYSTKNEDVTAWLEKHKKEKEQWVSIASDYLTSRKQTRTRTVADSLGLYSHWYHDNNLVYAIGKENGDLDVGPYEYYYSNGRLQAKGFYSAGGFKIGDWYYYHDNGQLKSKETHNDQGNVEGQIINYLANGNLRTVGNYINGELDGFWEWYFPCGNLKEQYPYENGVGNGQGKVFYNTGEIKIAYHIKDDEMNGPYTNYYKSGKVLSAFEYVADEISGDYISYHANGEKHEVGQYKESEFDGIWQMYYSNGQLTHEGEFKKGNRIGHWKYFHFNGNVSRTEQYDQDSLLHGKTTWHDDDGVLYCTRIFNRDTLVGYSYFSKSGEVLQQEENPDGNMNYKQYYPSGRLFGEGKLVAGNINGPYTTYHQNGKVYQQGSMKDNEWDQEYKEYDESGMLVQQCYFDEGTINGYYKTLYVNGNTRQEGWVLNGQIEQLWNEYHTNGSLASQYYYNNGVLNGTGKTYGPNGLLFSEELYDEGLLLNIKQYDTLGVVYNEISIPASGGVFVQKSPSGKAYFSKELNCGEDVNAITYFFPSGDVQSKYDMNNSQLKSYRRYHVDGSTKIEGDYLNDEPTGDWSFYFENGKLDTRNHYQNGKLEGPSISYYEEGGKRYDAHHYQDKRDGPTTYYAPGGEVQLVKYFKKDVGSVAYQYPLANGMMSDTIYMNNAGKEEMKAYFSNGKVSTIQQYANSHFHGDVIFYDAAGNMLSKTKYANGENHGKQLHYYANGQIKSDVDYWFDEKHGEEKTYYKNGKLKEVINWVCGKRNGWTRNYSEKGKLSTEIYYWNDAQY